LRTEERRTLNFLAVVAAAFEAPVVAAAFGAVAFCLIQHGG
jgi:hypothetical protein